MLLSIIQQNYDCAWQLLHAKADPNLSSQQHGSPIYQCVLQNAVRTLKQVLKYGATIQYVDQTGATAFHVASRLKRHECLECLLETKPDVLIADAKGNTPMHDAIIHKDYVAIQMLMQIENCFIHRNNDGFTPIEMAKHLGHQNILQLLMSENSNVNPDNYVTRSQYYQEIVTNDYDIAENNKFQGEQDYNEIVQNFQTKYSKDFFEKSSAVGYYDDPNIEYWEEHYDKKSNDTYWFNTKTGESSWEVPDEISDFHHRRKYEGANHDSIQEFRKITKSNSDNDNIKKNAHIKIANTEADWETYRV